MSVENADMTTARPLVVLDALGGSCVSSLFNYYMFYVDEKFFKHYKWRKIDYIFSSELDEELTYHVEKRKIEAEFTEDKRLIYHLLNEGRRDLGFLSDHERSEVAKHIIQDAEEFRKTLSRTYSDVRFPWGGKCSDS